MYKYFLKPIFFLFDPEKIHHFVFGLLRFTLKVPGAKAIFKAIYVVEHPTLEREVFGIRFKNPVGLAAGFDKDATLYNELEHVGFGFVEIGTVTPVAQAGNPKKRLFRVPEDEGLINRMGFNNGGAKAAAERLKKRKTNIIIGGNIGKNKVTPNAEAVLDYEKCFEELYAYVDYFVVNVSSPNTPGLRALQDPAELIKILGRLMELNRQKSAPKPILLKIAPDLTNEDLDDIIKIVGESGIDGVIAANTTIDKSKLKTDPKTIEAIHRSGDLKAAGDKLNGGEGGLSGRPVTKRSTEVIKYLADNSNRSFPIIGVGGIHSAEEALEKLEAGASLVQIYTGFVYEGPSLVKKINKGLLNCFEA